MKKRLVYMLRMRFTDRDEWGQAVAYPTMRQRDKEASFNRIIGGMRTHSYEEYDCGHTDDVDGCAVCEARSHMDA